MIESQDYHRDARVVHSRFRVAPCSGANGHGLAPFPVFFSTRTRLRASVMRRCLVLAASLFASLFCLMGCDSGGCGPGDHCECSGGDECFLGCNGDNCNQACFSMNRCGTVCGNGCVSTCHDLGTECSQSCGADCTLTCSSTPTCGVICGDDCHLDCHDTPQCAADVGPGSDVTCTSVASCVVQCSGACNVHCANVSSCEVTCAGGTPAAACDAGRYACGGC
jgi:hypothetical protein